MAKINFNNKNTGDQFTASEVNEIKSVVNTNDTRVENIVSRNVVVSDEFGSAPLDANHPGTRGELRIVGGYMYLCVLDNVWVRAPVEMDWTL